MAFDKEYYNEVKKFMDSQLENMPWCVKVDSPFEWAQTFAPLIEDCSEEDDFEAAKAVSDAIRDFYNKFLPDGEKIPDDMKVI